MRNIFIACLLLTVGLLADNNLVTTLSVKTANGKSSFEMPRNGWIRIEGALPETVTFSGPTEVTVFTRKNFAVAKLPAGKYTVNAQITLARRIGNNMYYQMCGRYDTDDMVFIPSNRRPTGRSGMFIYHWKYLRENVLDYFPVLMLNAPWGPEMDRWKAEGRKTLLNSGVYATGKECETKWEAISARHNTDGFVTDEFVIPTGRKNPNDAAFGYSNQGNGFKPEIYDAMRKWHRNHPNMTLWGWLGLPWNAIAEDVEPLIKVLDEIDGVLLWEAYAHTRDFQNEFNLRYVSRIKGFKKVSGDFSRYVVAPGTFEYLDENAYIDFKVWLDKQLHLVATHPDMANLGGISMWSSYYMEPEIFRWFTELVRHYAIEGNTEMLSDKYGFKLEPGLLKDAEWETLDHWNCFGKTELIPVAKSGLPPSAYIPRSSKNMLSLQKGLFGKASGATQKITGLKPGQYYSVSTLFVDPEQNGDEILYDVELTVDNAEVIQTRVRQLQDFVQTKKPTYNHIKVVFKAKGTKALLKLSTREKTDLKHPLLVDSVSVKPYFYQP